jgi:hypothetical protein
MFVRMTPTVVSIRTARRIASVAALGLALLPSIGSAQVAAGRGFLLGVPDGTITLRGGWALASANSDIFSFTTGLLTLRRRDFSSPTVAGDVAFRVLSKTDFVISTGYSGMSKRSEFRGFIDNNDLPIEQHTQFMRVPLTVSVKQYLTSRGRSIGHLAWVPSRATAYVGAGGGATWYRFRQDGDFIDFADSSVFSAVLQSDGWSPEAHVLAGVEWNLGARFAAVTEGRYERSHATLGADFSNFGPIDLSGFSTTAGIAVRF